MVVLSAAICTKNGKAVMARQFVPMTRLRIEGLLAAFPKLIGTKSEHTFVETENVRYVYQPLEELFLLLVTNKQSNIMEDLDTLRLLAKLVPVYCQGQTQEAIADNAFDLIFAFDEVITIGYKEHVDIAQVRKYTEMDSIEEKAQKIIRQNKESDAKAFAKQKAQFLKQEEIRRRQSGLPSFSERSGISSESQRSDLWNTGIDGSSDYGGFDESADGSEPYASKRSDTKYRKRRSNKSGNRPGGMQIGGDKSKSILGEEQSPLVPLGGGRIRTPRDALVSGIGDLSLADAGESIILDLREEVIVKLDRNGSLEQMDILGSLSVIILDPDKSKIEIQANGQNTDDFKFQTHPRCLKESWKTDGNLRMKISSDKFPIGADNRFRVLRWKIAPPIDDSRVPLTLNFWPSKENGLSVINVEYQSQLDEIALNNVVISIPCPGITGNPEIKQVDGDTNYDRSDGVLHWHIDLIDPKSSGSMEFQVDELDVDDFYPVKLSFSSEKTLGGVNVVDVINIESKESYGFQCKKLMVATKYTLG